MPTSWFSEEKMHRNFIKDVYAMDRELNFFIKGQCHMTKMAVMAIDSKK